MEYCTLISRCLICRRTIIASSPIDSEKLFSHAYLLQDFLNCFHINVLDSEVHDLSTSCQFCRTCEQFVAEWSSIQTQMTQLTRRGTQLKATLSSLLLCAPEIHEQNHNNDVNDIINNRILNSQEVELPLLLQQTVDDIRNELGRKYLVDVLVDKIQLPCPPSKWNHEDLDPLSGHCDNYEEPMDDWRSADDDDTDAECLPSDDQMEKEETSEQIFEMKIKTEKEASSDDSDGGDSLELKAMTVNRKSKTPTKIGRKRAIERVPKMTRKPHIIKDFIPDGPNRFKYKTMSFQRNEEDETYTCDACGFRSSREARSIQRHILRHLAKPSKGKGKCLGKAKRKKRWTPIIADGLNAFKYNGHSLKLNVADQRYYCDACGFKGKTTIYSVLVHIRENHYTEEDKRNFTAVKKNDTEWLYGGKYKITKEGEKFKCVTCGHKNPRLFYMIGHIRNEHVDLQGPTEEVPLPVTDTPSVNDSIPIEGVFRNVHYTFNPADKKYTCGTCQTQFSQRRVFLTHVHKHRTEYFTEKKKQLKTAVIPDGLNTFKYNGHGLKLNDQDQCYYCGACDFKGTSNMHTVLVHIRELHYTEEDKQNFTAVKMNDNEWLYGGKYKILRVGEKFKCVLCGSAVTNLNGLIYHIRTQHLDMEDPDEVLVPMPATDTPSMNDSTPIQGHYKSVPYIFNPINNKYTCGICQTEVATSRKSFGRHMRKRHTDAALKVICEICGKELSNREGYQHHLKVHQMEPKNCPTCNKTFTNTDNFNRHLKIHTFGEALKNHQCEYCGKKFYYANLYRQHVLVHTGEKPHECQICEKKYRSSSELSLHREQAHGIMRASRKLMRIN